MDEETELDPELAAVVRDVEASGVPEWHAMSVAAARRVEDRVFTAEDRPEIDFVRTVGIDGPGGGIPLRAYRGDVETPAPTVVFYHGGGWTLGTLDSIDAFCRLLARRVGCLVISVDYRLAPEHPFPAAVDDAYAALEWAAEHADAFGGDPGRLAVAGTSAGGNLAAVTALRARELDGPDLVQQLLCYPMTDARLDRESHREDDCPLLSTADVAWFWDQYVRSPVDEYNPFAAPMRADDLSGLPPATVVTAGFDPLRDEGVAYAERLAAADVDVDHQHYPSMVHGFLSLVDEVAVADDALHAVARSVAERF